MSSEHPEEHRGIRPRSKHGRNRPTGGLQARLRALSAVGHARDADLLDPRPECAHALADAGEVHCTSRAFLAEKGVHSAKCIGRRCGHADLPAPKEP